MVCQLGSAGRGGDLFLHVDDRKPEGPELDDIKFLYAQNSSFRRYSFLTKLNL